MLSEQVLNIEAFGNGAVFEPIHGRESVKDWTVFAYLIGEANGCPRVTRNLRKQTAQEYFEKHVVINSVWCELVDVLSLHNPVLCQSLFDSEEVVPQDESFDLECVPSSYSEGRMRKGLAMDSAYFLVKYLVEQREQIGEDEVMTKFIEMAGETNDWFDFTKKVTLVK